MKQSDRIAFIPTKLEVTALFTLAAVVLLVLNYELITSKLLGESGSQEINKETLPLIQQYLLGLLSFITANAATFIFWLVVAYVGIVVLDVIRWLLRLYRSDVPRRDVMNRNLNPAWKKDIFVHFTVRSIALLGLIAWAMCLFVVVLPFTRTLFADGLQLGAELYKLPLACLVLGMYTYLAGILLKLLLLRRQLFQ